MPRRPQTREGDIEDDEPRVERTVRHAMVSYTGKRGQNEIATRGQVIELPESEAERMDELGAFEETYDAEAHESPEAIAQLAIEQTWGGPVSPGDPGIPPTTAPTAIPEEDDLSEMDDETLTEYVNSNSVGDIAEAVATADSAQRVIETEKALRGSEARKTLIQAMEAIVAQEMAAADNNDDEPIEDLTTGESE